MPSCRLKISCIKSGIPKPETLLCEGPALLKSMPQLVCQAMVEGTRVECIIGATRIRDFSTATEVLRFENLRQAESCYAVGRFKESMLELLDFVQGVASESHDLRESDCRGLVLSCA